MMLLLYFCNALIHSGFFRTRAALVAFSAPARNCFSFIHKTDVALVFVLVLFSLCFCKNLTYAYTVKLPDTGKGRLKGPNFGIRYCEELKEVQIHVKSLHRTNRFFRCLDWCSLHSAIGRFHCIRSIVLN